MTIFYRRLPKFDYLRPASLDEALQALSPDLPVGRQLLCGGTDLLPKLKSRAIPAPPCVIDLKGIPGLGRIAFEADGLSIGATAAIRDVAGHDAVRRHYGALAEGAALIASNQLQHRGTIVGNVCNAVPSADSAPPLLVHEAQVRCIGPHGERSVALDAFFVDAGVTALGPREMVTALHLPPPPPGERSTYLKLAPRGRMDLAVVGVAAAVVVDAAGIVRRARLALGSAAPVPLRAREAEAALEGRPADAAAIERAAALAAAHARTRSSHGVAGYRRDMLEVLVRRALTQLTQPAAEPAAETTAVEA